MAWWGFGRVDVWEGLVIGIMYIYCDKDVEMMDVLSVRCNIG